MVGRKSKHNPINSLRNKTIQKGKVRKFFAKYKTYMAASTVLFMVGLSAGIGYGTYEGHVKEQIERAEKQNPKKTIKKALANNTPKDVVSKADKKEKNPFNEQLLEAVMKGDVEEAKHLLDTGADPNGENSPGCPFLTWAAWNNDKEMVLLLIEKGVDVNAEDPFGCSALDIAKTFDKKEMVELLKGYGAK